MEQTLLNPYNFRGKIPYDEMYMTLIVSGPCVGYLGPHADNKTYIGLNLYPGHKNNIEWKTLFTSLTSGKNPTRWDVHDTHHQWPMCRLPWATC